MTSRRGTGASGQSGGDPVVLATVYRSTRRDECYVFVRAPGDVDSLPGELRRLTGDLVQVMELELSRKRALARENVETVMANLLSQGYHLQLPPKTGEDSVAR